MALWDPEVCCPLCGQPTGNQLDLLIAFTCLGSYDVDVSILDDAVAHSSCVDSWNRRDAFVAAWNAEAARNDSESRDFLVVDPSGHVQYANLWPQKS